MFKDITKLVIGALFATMIAMMTVCISADTLGIMCAVSVVIIAGMFMVTDYYAQIIVDWCFE